MKKLLLLTFLAAMSLPLHAQLWVDTTNYTPAIMVNDFFGNSPDVLISNVTYTGSPNALSFFDASQAGIGVNAGMLLTTGNYAMAADSAGTFASESLSIAGDTDLTALINNTAPTLDATVLEFDIVPNVSQINFKYVFGSEEYPEFVNTSFNDVFAFFITGAGLNGITNIATLPDGTPVAINNVNAGMNAAYYVDNINGTSIAYDAYTTPLSAPVTVIPGESYHVKIAIADAADAILDSGVFLSIESLGGLQTLPTQPDFLLSVLDNSNTVTFNDNSRYATNWLWDFGDGTTSTERNPTHTYAQDLATHQFNVTLTTSNFCCTQTKNSNVGTPTTGIEQENVKPIKLFPNPAKGALFVDLGIATEGVVRISDMQGKNLVERPITQGERIDLDALGKGIFFVTVRTATQVHEQKVVNTH